MMVGWTTAGEAKKKPFHSIIVYTFKIHVERDNVARQAAQQANK